MNTRFLFDRPIAAAAAIITLVLATGCSKPTEIVAVKTSPVSASTTTQITQAPPAKIVSKLGDLTAFSSIAVDVATTVEKGDLSAAKSRIKDLEVAWDSAEAGLKPRAADEWHFLDKKIDLALRVLRADKPSQVDCKNAMLELLKVFDLSVTKS